MIRLANQTAIHLTPVSEVSSASLSAAQQCPSCPEYLFRFVNGELHATERDYIYSDGDSIPGLWTQLLAANLVQEWDEGDFSVGRWFDVDRLTGTCSFCQSPFYSLHVSMIAPEAKMDGGIVTTYFHHNRPHEDGLKLIATYSDGIRSLNWLSESYFTSSGLVLQHQIGFFPTGELRGEDGDWARSKNLLVELWPSLVATTRDKLLTALSQGHAS